MKGPHLPTVTLVLLLLLLDADAARRFRSTTTTTATATSTSTAANDGSSTLENRRILRHPPQELHWEEDDDEQHRQEHSANLGDWGRRVAVTHQGTQRNSLQEARQYPGIGDGGSPGGTPGEIPRPISPPLQPVPPPLPPGCLAPRGQFPSANSCANYINCWDDTAIEQTCPNGLLFNDLTGFCDFDYNVNCGARPPPTPKPPLQPGSKYCPEPNGRYRSSTNCSEFYVCLVGKPIKFSCPRGLVYNDEVSVCDYVYNVDCQGAATPSPGSSSEAPETRPPPPPPPPGTGGRPTSPRPTQTRPPSYPGAGYPSPTQQPAYPPPPQQPSYPAPAPPSSYPENPWLAKDRVDPWHQRPPATQIELEREQQANEPNSSGLDDEVPTTATLGNPWAEGAAPVVPPDFHDAPCNSGDVHRLDDGCTSVVVCKNRRPQLVQCPVGLTYDRPSDSCQHFTLAKC